MNESGVFQSGKYNPIKTNLLGMQAIISGMHLRFMIQIRLNAHIGIRCIVNLFK